MTTGETVIRRMLGEVIDAADYGAMPELATDGYVDHTPMGDIEGREGYAAFLEQFRAALPGFRHEVTDVTELGDDYYLFQVHFTGTFTGEFMGTAGDGRAVDLWVANGARFEGDRVAEHWGMGPDAMAEIMGQMGVRMAPA